MGTAGSKGATRFAIVTALEKKDKKLKKKGGTEHPNVVPPKDQPLKGLHAGAKAIPPKKSTKTKKKSKKANVPNPY